MRRLDRTSRYSTATGRALYRAIEELERLQAARKAREQASASTDAEPAKRPAELDQGQPEKPGENPASSDSRAFEDPEDGVGRLRRHRGWRGFTTPARASTKSDFAKRTQRAPGGLVEKDSMGISWGSLSLHR